MKKFFKYKKIITEAKNEDMRKNSKIKRIEKSNNTKSEKNNIDNKVIFKKILKFGDVLP